MRAIGRFLAELVAVFLSGVVGFFVMLILAAGAVLAWLIGCASALFVIIAFAESGWWLYTHDHHAAVTALGYYGYAAGTFALIPVLFFLRGKLTGWPERHRRQAAMRRVGALRLAHDERNRCEWITRAAGAVAIGSSRSAAALVFLA